MSRVHSRAALIPTQPSPIRNARLAAELQAVALAHRIGWAGRGKVGAGEGWRAGTINAKKPAAPVKEATG